MNIGKLGKNDAVGNYMRSIPKAAKTVRMRPCMKDGVCVGTTVSYELNGAVIEKEIKRGTGQNINNAH